MNVAKPTPRVTVKMPLVPAAHRPFSIVLSATPRDLRCRVWPVLREYASCKGSRISDDGGLAGRVSAKGSSLHATAMTTETDRELVYVGPFTEHARRFKWYALVLSACGLLIIPTILIHGEKPIVGAFVGERREG
jgi:hypothetical protein